MSLKPRGDIVGNQDFISNLHKGFNFPLDILREYIEKNTSIKVSDFVKITDGYDSEVYDIGLFMVKIRQDGDVPYACIRWVVDKCKEQNVKTVNIIHYGKILDKDIMIEEKIHGQPLPSNLYEEAGAELKKIHNIKVDGFWRMHENGKFDFDNYKDVAGSFTRDRMDEMPLICAGGVFSHDHIEHMKNVLYEAEKLDVSAVLCHGDYAPRHILCGEHINGIIDYGNFHGGSRYVDLTYFSLNSEEKYFDKFIKGYGEIDENELRLNKIMLLMGYLAHSRKIGDEEDAKKLERKLLRIFTTMR